MIDIFSSIIILLVFQVFPDIDPSGSTRDHAIFPEMQCTRIIQVELWVDNPLDDNPGEIKNHFFKVFIGKRPGDSFGNDLAFMPVKQLLLNPLYLDRPPPVVSL